MSDSAQVQCIQSYSSQEPDELSVEMADVLHILECTDDGKRSQTLDILKNQSVYALNKRFAISHATWSDFAVLG